MDSENRPVSRREARQQRRDVEPAPAPRDDDAETTALPAEHDASAADTSANGSADRPKRSRRRLWIWLTVVVVILALLVAGGLAAKRLYDQAMGVRTQLESAMTDVAEVQRAVLAGESDAATAAASQLSTKTRAAVAGTSGTLWGLAEAVPFIGDDLAAVRLVAEATDHLAAEVVTPAASISLDTFRPQDGRIDVQAVADLVPLIDRIDAGVNDAVDTLEPIDRSALISQVAGGVKQLDDALSEIQPMIQPVRDVASVLPNALGANGPRNYLLMFQGNSEARSLGGNAASFMVLRAEDGRLAIVDQASSSDFQQPLPEPVVPLDEAAVNIYGDKIGRYTPDFTMVPDFPTAAGILQGWWAREGRGDVDAFMSFDPIGLSYLLPAIGPVTLATGDVLTPENAAQLLLNEPYFRFNSLEQNAFFAVTAADLTGAHAELMASVGPATDLATRVTQAMDRAVDVLPAEQIDAVRAAAGGLSDEAGRAGAVALPADLEVPDDRPASIAQAEEEIAATEERAAAVTAARDGIDASSDALAGAHAALLAALDTAYGTLAGVAEAEHDANPLPAAYLHEALDVAADAVLAARAAGGEGLVELDEFIAAVDVLRQEQARLAALEAADDGIGYTPVTPPSSSGGGDTGGDTGGGTGTETPAPTDPQPTDPSQPTEEPVPPPDTGT